MRIGPDLPARPRPCILPIPGSQSQSAAPARRNLASHARPPPAAARPPCALVTRPKPHLEVTKAAPAASRADGPSRSRCQDAPDAAQRVGEASTATARARGCQRDDRVDVQAQTAAAAHCNCIDNTIAMRWRWACHVVQQLPCPAQRCCTREVKIPIGFSSRRPRASHGANGQRGRAHSRPRARVHAHQEGDPGPGRRSRGVRTERRSFRESASARARARCALRRARVH